MAIIRYPGFTDMSNPFNEMAKMKREMDRLFTDLLGRAPIATGGSGVFPSLNVSDDGEKIYVQAELPGISPDEIEISVERNTLTLKGERRHEHVEDASYHRRERKSGGFHKALTLPYEINPDGVQAVFENGVLKLVLPKAEHARPKKISVRIG